MGTAEPRILMYHGLDSPARPTEMTDPGDVVYVLDRDDFVAQLAWLDEHPWPSAILTFDDGHVSNFEVALPILRERSRRACFFVTTDWIGREHYMTEPMLRELAAHGMEIGSHGASHRFLTDLTAAQAETELRVSKQRLERILGSPVTTFSAPGGRIDRRVAEIATALGYRRLYTSSPTPGFSVAGAQVCGRIALKRGYSLADFARLMATGREPESALRRHGLAIAKNVLGNRRYERARALIFRLMARSR